MTLFDCDVVETPPVCYNGNDVAIATGSKDAHGNFTFMLPAPLRPGQTIYVTDGCRVPVLRGPFVVVAAPAMAPALSPTMLVVLGALLTLVGVLVPAAMLPRRRR